MAAPFVPDAARPASPLPSADVSLAPESVFAPAGERMLHLARTYPIDRLLAVFRDNAGLDTLGARPPGNWEDFGHPEEEAWGEHDYPGRERARTANLLRGHYAGHFLSMLAKAYSARGEQALKSAVDALVNGLAEVQRALAETGRYSHPGFLAAYGEWQFSRLELLAPYGEIWAPYYTTHKIMAGLLDAHELTGNQLALEVVAAMARWVHHRLSQLEATHRQRMWSLYIAGEFGGMNETLARLAALTGDELFLVTARFFDQEDLLTAGAEGRDVLDGMHANQHLPQLIGYVHEHALTGEDRYLATASELFDQVVPGRMYPHGGTGEGELWGPAGTVAGGIGHRNAETCAAYNLVKLARLLLARTGKEKYADYIERALANQVLGSRRAADSDVSPEVTYMFPVHPGAVREYDNVGTCCGGTGLENHVTYEESLTIAGPHALWIVLATDATIVWREQGLRLWVRTEGPFGGRVLLDIEELGEASAATSASDAGRHRAEPDGPQNADGATIHLHIPRWAGNGAHLRMTSHGEVAGQDVQPGTFHPLHRFWRAGDRIELDLPAGVVATATIDDPSLYSLSVGPSILLARSERSTVLSAPLRGLRRLDGTLTGATWHHLDGEAPNVEVAGCTWEPAWSGGESRYHLFVRAADEEIAFAGHVSGVPERPGADGSTVLQEVWAAPLLPDREAFLQRVSRVVAERSAAGLLRGEEPELVLRAAVCADIDGNGAPQPETSAVRLRELIGALPEIDPGRIPPTVRLVADVDAAPSGWFTTRPRIALLGEGHGHAELRIGDGTWNSYVGPVALTEGEHRVHARVRSTDGLVAHAVRDVSVDTVAPLSTARVKDLGGAWEITLDAEDATSGVDRIQWEGPGTFWGTFHEAFVRALTDTEQVIEFAATDRAGNQEPRRRLVLPARETEAG